MKKLITKVYSASDTEDTRIKDNLDILKDDFDLFLNIIERADRDFNPAELLPAIESLDRIINENIEQITTLVYNGNN